MKLVPNISNTRFRPARFTPSRIAGLIIGLILMISCTDQPVDQEEVELSFGNGVFIVNEGQFLASNASLSFYNPDSASIRNHVFRQVNQVPLGDVAHSMSIFRKEALVVVNNSGKIYRCSLRDLSFLGKITSLSSPRFILPIEGNNGTKAYISDLYSSQILVVNPLNGQRLDSIPIGNTRKSSEQMILHEDRLYVACWSFSDLILVLDTRNDQVIDSVFVGKQPNSMVLDKNKALWVLSDGGFAGSSYGQEASSLTRIDLETLEPERKKTWEDLRVSATDLCVNPTGDTLYLIAQDVFRFSTDMKGLEKPFINHRDRQFYALGVDPGDGTVYVSDAVDYQQNGWIFRYGSSGKLIDSVSVGVNPGYFCFTGKN